MARSHFALLSAFVFVSTASLASHASGQFALCQLAARPPVGQPVATLVVDIHINCCYEPQNRPTVRPCCPSAASIDLPPGRYVVTMSGQECTTESRHLVCNTDGSGSAGHPTCRFVAWGTGNCAADSRRTNACELCDPRVGGGGPIVIVHPGGRFYAWRNDNYWGDNYGLQTINFFPACIADIDNGTGTGMPDGAVTVDDLLYYLDIFESGGNAADMDDGSSTGAPDGGVTIEDLLYFLARFEAGC